MSWSIYATGTPEAVRKHVEEAHMNGNAQGEAAKAFILSELAQPLKAGDIVMLAANGHSDSGGRGAFAIKLDLMNVMGMPKPATVKTGPDDSIS